jgi:hypothetical protein
VKVVAEVGWLVETGTGISVPNFDYHISESAKTRALTAKRVSKSKNKAKESNGKGNGDSVTSSLANALPREEKRREEVNTKNISPDGEDTKKILFDSAKPILGKNAGSLMAMAIRDVGELEAMAALQQAETMDNPSNAFAASIRSRKAKIEAAGVMAKPVVYNPAVLSI